MTHHYVCYWMESFPCTSSNVLHHAIHVKLVITYRFCRISPGMTQGTQLTLAHEHFVVEWCPLHFISSMPIASVHPRKSKIDHGGLNTMSQIVHVQLPLCLRLVVHAQSFEWSVHHNILDKYLAPMKVTMLRNQSSSFTRYGRVDLTHTSKETSCSACPRALATCQKMLQACFHLDFPALGNVYASRSDPPLGNTMIAYTWETLKESSQMSSLF
jgi:hypothetical protein